MVNAQLSNELPDCQCIGECDTTTATGLHYCVIGDDPQCKGIYGDTATDSIDGTTLSDGLFESYCGVIYGDYDCKDDPCLNGSYCVDGMNTYTCVCQPGFTGVDCESDVNECGEDPSPCAENAGCADLPGSFTCECLSGFDGDGYATDETGCTDVDDCASSPCQNGSTCADAGPNAFECACAEGWIGEQCEIDVDECMDGTDSCDEDARCENQPGSFACECNHGFTGDGISGTYMVEEEIVDYVGCNDVNDCSNSPCMNEGTCNDAGVNSFMCFCSVGWVGTICNVDENECQEDTHACDANAECDNHEGGYSCTCNSGWTGDGETCTDADDCEVDQCRNGGTCVDQGENSYSCDCPLGFMGVECEVDENECETGKHICHDSAVCTNNVGSFECACDAGFSGDGYKACDDINDCESSPCVHGTCTDNGANSYGCNCESGWKDTNCDMDINECVEEADTVSCSEFALCANSDGSYTCTCNAGYEGEGEECADINDCEAHAEDPCTHGTCLDNGPGAYKCECTAGWTDSHCDYDVDECATGVHECYANALCTNIEGSYTCTCMGGFEGDGVASCTDKDDCISSPCANGECIDAGTNSYECKCQAGWKDTNCDFDVNECIAQSDDCHEDARCVNTPGSFECRCRSGWEGDGRACKDVNDCQPDPCVFGTCTDGGPNAYTCDCADGWQSDNCDVDIDECIDAVHACDVRASCTNEQGSYTCRCQDEYYGDGTSCYPCEQCEAGYEADSQCDETDRTCKDIDECATNAHNCDSSAACKNMDGSFTCMCDKGFFGAGTECEACTECEAGYSEDKPCTSTTDRTCKVDVKTGLYTLESEADGSEKCLVFSGEGVNQYPERYNWGNSEQFCGIPQLDGMTAKEALLSNRQAIWKVTQVTRDLYTLESNADGKGWRCMQFGMDGKNQYPDRSSWGEPDQQYCGIEAQAGASQEESLLANAQAVFKLERIEGNKFLIKSNADHEGYMCMVFGGHGYDTNPRRMNWGNGDEMCGAGHWDGKTLKDAVLENKQAVWVLNWVSACPNGDC